MRSIFIIYFLLSERFEEGEIPADPIPLSPFAHEQSSFMDQVHEAMDEGGLDAVAGVDLDISPAPGTDKDLSSTAQVHETMDEGVPDTSTGADANIPRVPETVAAGMNTSSGWQLQELRESDFVPPLIANALHVLLEKFQEMDTSVSQAEPTLGMKSELYFVLPSLY